MVMFVCLLDFQSDIFSVVYIEAVLCFFCYGFICLYGLFYLVVQFVAFPLFRSITYRVYFSLFCLVFCAFCFLGYFLFGFWLFFSEYFIFATNWDCFPIV